MKSIGERIRQAREARGFSGLELARAVGYKNQSAIGNIENRAVTTGGRKLPAIARALRTPVEWLINGPDGDQAPFAENLYNGPPTDGGTLVQETQGHLVQPLVMAPDSTGQLDAWTHEAVRIMKNLQAHERPGAIAHLRTYVHNLGPPRYGQPVSLTEKRENVA